MVDTAALQAHVHIVQEKQRNARNLIDRLHQISGNLQPELGQDCYVLLRIVDEFLHYYREQEAMLLEMSHNYEATSHAVSDMLDEAMHIAENIL